MTRSAREAALFWREHTQKSLEPDFVLGIAGSFTVEPIEVHLGSSLIDRGWKSPKFRFADYNQLHQLCLEHETVFGGSVDHVLALWRIEDVFSAAVDGYLDDEDERLAEIVSGVEELALLFGQLSSKVAVTVADPPFPSPWGVDLRDSRVSRRLSRLYFEVGKTWNETINEFSRVTVFDLATLVLLEGIKDTNDLTKWALYHQPYSSQFWIEIGEASSAVIASGYRPTPKCVVLDCDNTLWGGIIGEDGLGGIELNDTFPGSAFRVFQKRLVQLRAAGIMLAIASKNDISIVEEVFASHGEMILGKDDISCWKVNWLPKSENIREIASELNIGLDSLVFVDDSSFELAEVEMALPEVSLLQVPDELSELPSVIADSGLFRHISVSDEDRERTQMMLAESSRKKVQSTLSGEAFLQSLELEVEVFSLREEHIARVAQLTNKTNQFNLTTVRRSESEIAALMESEVFEVRAVRVADRFGDYGVVGVAVIERMKDGWLIDSFLLSCRVLGRGVESAFLSALVEEAKSDGIELVEGRYNPTVKNGQVATFYQDHGFLIKDGVFENLYSGELTVPTHVALKR